MERLRRKLAAILAADVVGYSRLMGIDEAGTLARLKTIRREVVDPAVLSHGGRIVKTAGDGLLLEFPSAVEAVDAAVAIQQQMITRRGDEDRRFEFRIGINLGDVMLDEDDIYGDGVNVAARLEALADVGGICISRSVRDQIRDRLPYALEDRGEISVKNIARPVRVFAVDVTAPAGRPVVGLAPMSMDALAGASHQRAGAGLSLPDKPSIAVLPFTNMSGDPEQEYFADGRRGSNHRIVANPVVVCDRSKLELYLQGESRRLDLGCRARTRRPVHTRREPPTLSHSHQSDGPARRCDDGIARLGRQVRPRHWRHLRPSR